MPIIYIYIFLFCIGIVCFLISTRPDRYIKDMILYKREHLEQYKEFLKIPFIKRYWNRHVLNEDCVFGECNKHPGYVILIFSYITVYFVLNLISEHLHIRIISKDDDITYIFGLILILITGVVVYPVTQYILAKLYCNEPLPGNRHWKAAGFFLLLYILCAFSFLGLLSLGVSYGVAEGIAATPLIISGYSYLFMCRQHK